MLAPEGVMPYLAAEELRVVKLLVVFYLEVAELDPDVRSVEGADVRWESHKVRGLVDGSMSPMGDDNLRIALSPGAKQGH